MSSSGKASPQPVLASASTGILQASSIAAALAPASPTMNAAKALLPFSLAEILLGESSPELSSQLYVHEISDSPHLLLIVAFPADIIPISPIPKLEPLPIRLLEIDFYCKS